MKLTALVAPVALVIALGCSTAGPSPELVDARRAYDQARTSQAAAYRPDRLLEARQALERAEKAYQDQPGSFQERGLAYIATRRAELAVIYGSYDADQRERGTYEQTYRQRQDSLRRSAERSAASSRRELESARENLSSTSSALDRERDLRQKAEGRAGAALASLQEVARVKEEARGTVITLDGAVLFASGKSDLLPIAQTKLDDVAKALNDTDDGQRITVEGHTDSNGNDEANLKLSQSRADSVRSYLIGRGVKGERIQAVGKGESRPVADNATPEGRANNRRVEIVLEKPTRQ